MLALARADDPATGFARLTNPQAARRQLTVSLTVVAMLAVGILAAALAVDDGRTSSGGASVFRAVLAHQASDRSFARDPRR